MYSPDSILARQVLRKSVLLRGRRGAQDGIYDAPLRELGETGKTRAKCLASELGM
jgi:hypothetical protein